MLKLSDLAQRPDFHAGPLRVSPSRRIVEGPAGTAHVQPLIMQVFLLLLDANGQVVTRDELFDKVWGGVMVGDDSLNRAIAKVRRIASEAAPSLFEIETIPRTGYRLTGDILDSEDSDQPAIDEKPRSGVSRRAVIGSAAAMATVAIGGVGLWSIRSGENQRFRELVDRGRKALEYGHPSNNGATYLEQAVAMRPNNAAAQGLLAFSLSFAADLGDPRNPAAAVERAEGAVRTALTLDPDEPNARLAQIILQRAMLDLATTEDRLRQVLATAPQNIFAMRALWNLLQSTGRSHDALALIERAIEIEPLAAGSNFPRAQILWIIGRTAEADRVIDRAMQYWPLHPWVRFARFSIYAYTGRPRAALAMLNDEEKKPQDFTRAGVALWHIWLQALDQRSDATIAAARKAAFEAATQSPNVPLALSSITVLSALGEVDAAFDIANELMLFRPPTTPHSQDRSKRPPAKSTSWRFAPGLFTPPAAALRGDPRFKLLCDGIGLTEYWAKRRIKPDYQLGLT